MGALLDLAMSDEAAQATVAEHDPGTLPPLPPAQEDARRDVLARLKAHPAVNRVFVARWENDVLIVTLGIRDIGTGELSIPRERLGSDNLAAYGELLKCMDGAKS